MSDADAPRSFFEALCGYDTRLSILFLFCGTFFAISLATVVLLESGSGGHAVGVLNTVLLGGFTAAFGATIYRCRRITE